MAAISPFELLSGRVVKLPSSTRWIDADYTATQADAAQACSMQLRPQGQQVALASRLHESKLSLGQACAGT